MLFSFPDLHKTFVDDEHYNSGHGHAYDFYNIDPEKGAIVIVRPDHCMFECPFGGVEADLVCSDISAIYNFEEQERIQHFFEMFLVAQNVGSAVPNGSTNGLTEH